MPDTDKFGLISLGTSSRNDEIMLEEKSRNPYLKRLFLESMLEEEAQFQGQTQAVFRR